MAKQSQSLPNDQRKDYDSRLNIIAAAAERRAFDQGESDLCFLREYAKRQTGAEQQENASRAARHKLDDYLDEVREAEAVREVWDTL